MYQFRYIYIYIQSWLLVEYVVLADSRFGTRINPISGKSLQSAKDQPVLLWLDWGRRTQQSGGALHCMSYNISKLLHLLVEAHGLERLGSKSWGLMPT